MASFVDSWGNSSGGSNVASLSKASNVAIPTGGMVRVAVSLFRSAGALGANITDDAGNSYTQLGTWQLSPSTQEAMGRFYATNITGKNPLTVAVAPTGGNAHVNFGCEAFNRPWVADGGPCSQQPANSTTTAPTTDVVQMTGRECLLCACLRSGASGYSSTWLAPTPGVALTPTYVHEVSGDGNPLAMGYAEGILAPQEAKASTTVNGSCTIMADSFRPMYLSGPGSMPSTPSIPPPSQAVRTQRGLWALATISPPDFHAEQPDSANLRAPYVTGFLLRQSWSDLQPSYGTFDWTYLDAAIAACAAAGKQAKIDILAGIYCPTWIYDRGAKAFNHLPDVHGILPDATVQTVPVPFDAGYLSILNDMITAVGTRYATNTTVVAVTYGGSSWYTGELGAPYVDSKKHVTNAATGVSWVTDNHTSNWIVRGWTRTLYQTSFTLLATIWRAAFPNCQTGAQTAEQFFPPIDASGVQIPGTNFDNVLPQWISDQVVSYGSQASFQYDGWGPANPYNEVLTGLATDMSPWMSASAAGAIVGLQEGTVRQPGTTVAQMQSMLDKGVSNRSVFFEFYKSDLQYGPYIPIFYTVVAMPVLPFDDTTAGAVVPLNVDFSCISPNLPSTGTPAITMEGLGIYRSAAFYAELQGATGGTLDVYLQYSLDGGLTWADYIHFAQLAAGDPVRITAAATSKAGAQALTTAGGNESPGLAAGTVLGGDWGDQMRVLFVAGPGTTLGAPQTIKAGFSP